MSGPTGTFDDFYRREATRIAAVVAALTGRRELGEDLAQEAMLRAFRQWPKVSALESPGAWVRRVAIHLAIDSVRRTRTQHRMLPFLARPAEVEPTDVDDRFWTQVRALPERQRVAVTLHYLDDMSIRDIATVVRVSESAVKSALFAGRRALASALGTDEAAP